MVGNNNETAHILKMLEKMHAAMDESDTRIEAIATILQDYNKEPYVKEADVEEEEKYKRESLEAVKKGEEEEKRASPMDSQVDHIE